MNTLAYRLVPGNNTWNRLGRELNRASNVQKSTAASILVPILSIHSRLIGQPFITRITWQPVAIDAEGIFPPISPLGNLAAASGRPAGDEDPNYSPSCVFKIESPGLQPLRPLAKARLRHRVPSSEAAATTTIIINQYTNDNNKSNHGM